MWGRCVYEGEFLNVSMDFVELIFGRGNCNSFCLVEFWSWGIYWVSWVLMLDELNGRFCGCLLVLMLLLIKGKFWIILWSFVNLNKDGVIGLFNLL